MTSNRGENSKLFISNELLKASFNRDFIPLAITTTILAPLHRLKICLQTMKIISLNETEKVYRPINLIQKLVKDQGLFSLFRGNLSNLYKHFIISFSNILLYQRIRLAFNLDKDTLFHTRLFASSLSSLLSLVFYYPFEMANTRITADMTRYGHKKLYYSVTDVFSKAMEEESVSRNSLISNFSLTRIYKGFSVAVLSSVIYWTITIGCFEKLSNYYNSKKRKAGEDFEYYTFLRKMSVIFGATTLNAILASFIVYPLDTFKRHLQVTGSIGYKSDYPSGNFFTLLKTFSQGGIVNMYRGFGINLMKTLPFPLIHYTIYSNTQHML